MSGRGARRRVFAATASAFTAAVILLVTIVLPAEYGIDPLGTGAALGLLGLAEPGAGALVREPGPSSALEREFELGPFESIELKIRLAAQGTLVYAWTASDLLVSDFHSEPDGAPAGFAQSFDQLRAAEGYGSFRAPFSGWHGWFWENRTLAPVRLRLRVHAFSNGVREYRDGRVVESGLHPGLTQGGDPPGVSMPVLAGTGGCNAPVAVSSLGSVTVFAEPVRRHETQ